MELNCIFQVGFYCSHTHDEWGGPKRNKSQRFSSLFSSVPISTLGNCNFARQPSMHLSIRYAKNIQAHCGIRNSLSWLNSFAEWPQTNCAYFLFFFWKSHLSWTKRCASLYIYCVYFFNIPWTHTFLLQKVLSFKVCLKLFSSINFIQLLLIYSTVPSTFIHSFTKHSEYLLYTSQKIELGASEMQKSHSLLSRNIQSH